MFRVTLLAVLVKYKIKDSSSLQKWVFTLFWLINSTITSVVYTSYTSVLLRFRLYEPKHILIPTHMEVEILQQAHTVFVKTVVLCQSTVKIMLSFKLLPTPECELNLKLVANYFVFRKTREPNLKTSLRFDQEIPPHPVPMETFKTANAPKTMALFTLWQFLKYKYSFYVFTCSALHSEKRHTHTLCHVILRVLIKVAGDHYSTLKQW